jgi:hypothetical protein
MKEDHYKAAHLQMLEESDSNFVIQLEDIRAEVTKKEPAGWRLTMEYRDHLVVRYLSNKKSALDRAKILMWEASQNKKMVVDFTTKPTKIV